MNRKAILYHHRTQGKGVEGVHIRGMTDGFGALGYAVDMVSPPGVSPYADERQDDSPEAGPARPPAGAIMRRIADHFPQVLFELLEIGYNLYSFAILYNRLKSRKYTFIYERYSLFGFSCAILAKWFRVPLVLEVNDATLIERSRPLVLKRLARSLERFIFRRSDIIVTITGYFRKLILNADGITPEQVMVLPNAVDPERFRLKEKALRRADIGIKNQYVMGVVGAFVPWHGLDFLIEATHDLLPRLDIHILLVGDGPVRDQIEALAARYHVSEYVTMTGFLSPDRVPYYIDLMDIGLMPGSNRHCSPVKLFEYMAMGRPSVVPRYEPIEEIVDEGEDAIIFPPGDRAAFRAAVSRLIQDDARRRQMGDNARRKVLTHHVWNRNASRLNDEIVKHIG
ncbi:glycosyltransferase WbuB [Desulfonema ishimotonii]|uniref:Glycosyltransferase WbuB n=1 Tax=Desulfonema ishimotonii TaxID=45657 RepID=A0A401FQK6_9BACT|nr:glycosyltransferase family 4 protein [Desulfonema ishimotonii]GBC59247.1 glycosyltransferase WbuB [Desulfonema ishimotonii]